LFLDEIGDLPLELQPKILRVLQEKQFERLGSATTIRTDVRVVCATHQNLNEMVDERQFRADLFYRLSVFPLSLPPLRERPGRCPFVSSPFCNALCYAHAHARLRPFRKNSWKLWSGIHGRATSGSCKT